MEELSLALVCPLCEGSGHQVIVRTDGSRAARECKCRLDRRAARAIARAKIPFRYNHCTLDSFETHFAGATPSQSEACFYARRFVEEYRTVSQGTGLLFTGPMGVGKTHLSVAILKQLITGYGIFGLFCDYRELLKEVQNSYNRQVQATEREVLAPVFEADVLVLDELGAAKPSEWVWDTVAHILNTRYNDRRTTIITTNYLNAPSLGSVSLLSGEGPSVKETLGDRITDRMLSRLQEMCVVVTMDGIDQRRHEKRARFE
jgi:DNA replication protein DnaC